MKLRIQWSIPLVVGVMLPGCPFTACGCDVPPANAILYGRVTAPTSEGVAGATVIAYSVAADGCQPTEYEWLEYAGVTTESDGSYLKRLVGSDQRDDVCIFVFARPPSGSVTLATSDTTLVSLDFRLSAPEDSARVDLTLRSAGQAP